MEQYHHSRSSPSHTCNETTFTLLSFLQETQKKKKRKRGHVTLKRTAFAFKNPSSFRTDLELEPKAHPPRHHFKAGCRGVHCTDSSRHPPSHTLATSSELGLTASKTALQAGMNIAATFSASMLESPCGRLRPSATLRRA